MKVLNSTDDVKGFVEKYGEKDGEKGGYKPGDQFKSNLNFIKAFEDKTGCGDNCAKGFIIKNETETFFTDKIPKKSCVDYLTMQLVNESFPASKRDYTEVSNQGQLKITFVQIFAEKEQFKDFVNLINPEEERSGLIYDPVKVDVYLQVK